MRVADVTGKRIGFHPWSLKVPEPKAGTLDFARFPFQLELYQQGAADKELVVMKSTQVGVSAYLVRWTMYWADVKGLTALYVFPKLKQMYDFCIHPDERVLMADGLTKRAEDVEVGDRVLSFDGSGVVPDEVVRVASPGMKPMLRVELETGRRLRVSPWHRVWTEDGWREAQDLVVGTAIGVPRTTPEPEHTIDVPLDDAFLLALWLAEGTKSREDFTVTNALPDIRTRTQDVCDRKGWTLVKGENHRLGLRMGYQRNSSESPASLLRQYGVRGMRTDTVEVPYAIKRASRASAEEFLRTYIACDGSVSSREVCIASASERMVRDLQLLAARLGIHSTIRVSQPSYTGAMPSWTLAFAHRESRAAIERIGVPGKLSANGQPPPSPTSTGDLGWAKVRSINPDEEVQAADFETRHHHAYFLEGGLTHNSDARIRASILASPYLLGRIPGAFVQNKGLKQIGSGWVYYRGSESVADLDSVDADVLALDEYDTLKHAHIPDAERRITGSQVGLIRRVGVPSTPGWGIDALYQDSDRRRWHVKCDSCNERQYLTFEQNVDLERGLRVCRKCRKPLDVAQGEWVAEFPDRDVRGYHLPRLIVPGLDLPTLIKASEKTKPTERQVFRNKDLGEAFAPEEGRLSLTALQAAQSAGGGYTLVPGYIGAGVVTMGVDVASSRNLNVRVSEHMQDGRKRALFIGEVESFDDLALMMERFSVKMAVVDHLPEGRLARAFAERFPGRVYIVAFATAQGKVLDIKDEQRMITVRRVELLDATFEQVRLQRNLLPNDPPEGYFQQMQNLVRHTEEDEVGKVVVEYRSTGADDYAMAEAYDVVATEAWLFRQQMAESEREVFRPLEDMLEFSRANLSGEQSADDVRYDAGPADPEYDFDDF